MSVAGSGEYVKKEDYDELAKAHVGMQAQRDRHRKRLHKLTLRAEAMAAALKACLEFLPQESSLPKRSETRAGTVLKMVKAALEDGQKQGSD